MAVVVIPEDETNIYSRNWKTDTRTSVVCKFEGNSLPALSKGTSAACKYARIKPAAALVLTPEETAPSYILPARRSKFWPILNAPDFVLPE